MRQKQTQSSALLRLLSGAAPRVVVIVVIVVVRSCSAGVGWEHGGGGLEHVRHEGGGEDEMISSQAEPRAGEQSAK